MMRRLLVTVGVLALLGAACGEDDDAGVTVDDTVLEDVPGVDDPTPDNGDDVSVEVSDTDLGEILVDGEGMTLYMFTEDSEDQSACADECLTAWPPLTVDGEAVAGDGVDEDLLGTFTRDDDGSTQVTYNGHPLYFYAADSEPGDTTGQGVVDSWYVLSPDGTPIQDGATGDAGTDQPDTGTDTDADADAGADTDADSDADTETDMDASDDEESGGAPPY